MPSVACYDVVLPMPDDLFPQHATTQVGRCCAGELPDVAAVQGTSLDESYCELRTVPVATVWCCTGRTALLPQAGETFYTDRTRQYTGLETVSQGLEARIQAGKNRMFFTGARKVPNVQEQKTLYTQEQAKIMPSGTKKRQSHYNSGGRRAARMQARNTTSVHL